MADYDLAGLSTRSFEQLSQAISVKVLGHYRAVYVGRSACCKSPRSRASVD